MSVGQMAAKLQAAKVRVLKKNSAAQPESNSGSPESADWQNFILTAYNFEAN